MTAGRSAVKWILRNTITSRESLTPEFALHLITEASPLWMSTPDKCPLPDPYWAFYWPGGQAITRFVLDNPSVVRGGAVLDLGAGCGSATMAAIQAGASRVLANDIDHNALLATRLNMRLNGLRTGMSSLVERHSYSPTSADFSTENLLSSSVHSTLRQLYESSRVRVLILGDMFYDSDFADTLFVFLKRLKDELDVRILVGDPDRHPLAEDRLVKGYSTQFKKERLATYPLPGYVTKEHYGFSTAHVYEIHFP